jgi:two-component system sensor histidine kinase ChiS
MSKGDKIIGILLLFCLFLGMDAKAQGDARFIRLSRDNGLSHNNVYSIIQDQFGFMWFATQDGLNRYDGYNFKQFYHEPYNKNSLLSNNFGTVLEDEDGYLWFGTYYKGLSRFDPLNNEFMHFVHDELDPTSISSNHIRFLAKDKNGNIWIATSGGGLNKLNTKTFGITRYLHDEEDTSSISSNDVNAIVVDEQNNLWIGTNNSLDYFDSKSGEFQHFVLGYESFDRRKRLTTKTLLIDTNGLLWVGTSDGLYKLNRSTYKSKYYKYNISNSTSISDDIINTLFEDSEKNIWIGTEGGLSQYVKGSDSFVNYQFDITDPNSLSNSRVWSLYEDKSRVLWIGTKGGGVNKLDLKRKKFYSLAYEPNKSMSLSHPSVSTIVADTAGNIWLGTDGGGVCSYNIGDISVSCFNNEFSKKNLLSDDQIWAACYSPGKIWLGTHTGGLDLLQFEDGKYVIKTYSNTGDSTGISNNQLNSLLIDKDGFLWIGTRNGLNKMIDTSSTQSPYFITYKKSFSEKNSLTDNYITALYQDHEGFLWVGTYSGGLNRINLKTSDVKHFTSDYENPKSLGSNNIHTIFEDHLGNLWVGTSGAGLNKLNPDGNTFVQYHKANGLASNEVMAILEDYSGFLWISTSKGLSQFDPITGKFTNYDISDGLLSDGFNWAAAYQDNNGWMYFGTNSGLVYFHPAQIKTNSFIPEIVITSFALLEDDKWINKDIFISKYNSEENKIVLDYSKNIFSIEFAALDFTKPDENTYQYKIEGINSGWIDYGNKRTIMITNLEPGKYTLRVRGSNNDKVFNNEGVAVSIVVRPPFTSTEGFFFIVGVIALLIIISAYSFLVKLKTNKILAYKNKQLEQTNLKLLESEKSLKQLNETKDKFFSIIAHDLRNPFNPLLALTELLDEDYDELDEKERRDFIKEIRHGAKRLYDLLENLLHWALSQTRQIKFKQVAIDLGELVQNNIDLLKINAEKKNITIRKNFNGDCHVLADENMLNSIFRNLINNAIKFSEEKTEIFVNVEEQDENYLVEVRDQGIGIHEENLGTIFKGLTKSTLDNSKGKGSGLGLILCNEFVEKKWRKNLGRE